MSEGVRKTPSLCASETPWRILLIGHLARISQPQEQGERFYGGILFLASSFLIEEANSSLLSYYNSAASAPFNIPVLLAIYALAPVGVLDDTWFVKFSANSPTMPDAEVKSYAVRQIQTIQRAANVTITEPEWLDYQSHTPFQLQVRPEAIKDGFFKDLTALQGGLDNTMFYSGVAFHMPYSTSLWRYNRDVVIPMMTT